MKHSVEICGINTGTLPKINTKECEKLLQAVKNGDKGAKDRLILANMRLVLSVIKRFNTPGISPDDMFQAGCVGLVKATDNFDLTVGVKFSTYAVPMIIGEVKRFLRTRNSMRISRSIRDTAYRAIRARNRLERDFIEPTISEIAKSIDVCEREVAYALDAISDTVSLYDPVYSKEGDTLLIVDQIADENNTEEKWTEDASLTRALKELPDRERKIIYSRYYEGKTQTEISSEVGLSQAQVSRIEKNALMTMKGKIS